MAVPGTSEKIHSCLIQCALKRNDSEVVKPVGSSAQGQTADCWCLREVFKDVDQGHMVSASGPAQCQMASTRNGGGEGHLGHYGEEAQPSAMPSGSGRLAQKGRSIACFLLGQVGD